MQTSVCFTYIVKERSKQLIYPQEDSKTLPSICIIKFTHYSLLHYSLSFLNRLTYENGLHFRNHSLRLFLRHIAAVIWSRYCRYGVKHYIINHVKWDELKNSWKPKPWSRFSKNRKIGHKWVRIACHLRKYLSWKCLWPGVRLSNVRRFGRVTFANISVGPNLCFTKRLLET